MVRFRKGGIRVCVAQMQPHACLAIRAEVRQPGMWMVAVRNKHQQSTLELRHVRSQRMKFRHMSSPDGRVELLHLWPGKLPHLNCGKTGGLWGSFDGAGNARAGLLESVAFSLELEHMGVMHQAIEDSRGHGGIAQILSPVLDNAV